MQVAKLSPFSFEQFGDAVAITGCTGPLTFRDLAQLCDSSDLPIQAGDLAAVLCSNEVDTVLAYLACQRRGCPVLLLDSELGVERTTSLVDRFGVSIIFDGQWHRLLDRGPPMHPDLALLLSTSGSTGSPKLVRLSTSAVSANATAIVDYLGLTARDVAITSLPFHYSYGLSILHSHLLAGGRLVVTNDAITQREFWDSMKTHCVTNLAGVPIMYEWMRRLRVERMDLPHLRQLTQAGGRLPEEQVSWWAKVAQQKGWDFFVMYGQTEATARMAYLPPKLAEMHPYAIGQAIPGGHFELVDDAGEKIEHPEIDGELIYHGPNVMMGYAIEAGDLLRGDDLKGVLATGDTACRNSAGIYRIVGRKSRFLKIFGNRISLDHIETICAKAGWGIAATGRDDCLVIVSTVPAEADAAADLVVREVGVHPKAVNKLIIDELPRTSAGKVKYADMLATFDRGWGHEKV